MSNENSNVTRVHSDQQDNVLKAILRNLNPHKFINLIKRGFYCLKNNGIEQTNREIMFRVNLMLHRDVWKYRADIPLKRDLKLQSKTIFDLMPLISVIVPVYNTDTVFLKQCIKSCLKQSYSKIELILADASDDENVNRIFNIVSKFNDNRIKYIKLKENLGISVNTNEGINIAKGDYITLLDHDDVLQLNAIFEIVNAINSEKADFIYSDEAILNHNLKQLVMYHFKPDFSQDTLRGCNYITHLSAFSKQLMEKSGGALQKQFDGSQDFDLILRLTENAEKIVHIPKVLYFWRSHSKSTASGIEETKPYAIKAGENALNAHLQRLGLQGEVNAQKNHPGSFKVSYKVTNNAKISVIIPNKDHIDDLERVIISLKQKAGYDNYEILVVENNSEQKETFDYYNSVMDEKVKVIYYKGEFNYSKINNFAVNYANGEYLLLLNNDIEVLSDNFLYELLSYAQREDVGAVGAKLLYPDNTIQHAGIIIGIGGTAGHSHKSHPAKSGGDMYRLATTQNYYAVTGACLMVKKSLYQQLNGLNENDFAVAFNDVDFCLRLHKQGYLNVFTPFAICYHYESKSRGYDDVGANNIRFLKEKEKFVNKYKDIINNGDKYYNPHFTYLYENYGYK